MLQRNLGFDGVVDLAANGLSAVGIDRGLVLPVATSDGECFSFVGLGPREQVRLQRLNRRLARQKAMTASARGTVERPGSNVRQKSGLSRSILDKSWGQLRLTLEWHGQKNGCSVAAVPAAYTSQTCSLCKHVAAESRENQARFRCVACGFQANADVNAAKNILALGLRASGRGGLGIGPPLKRQPPERKVAYAPA